MEKRPKLVAIDGGAGNQPRLNNKVAEDFYNEMAIDVLARTLWGEARSEGTQGMEAVAHVILNRVKIAESKGKFWWGNNIIQVCQKPYQFSCWNRSDPNFKKLSSVDESDLYFASAVRVARRVVIGSSDDMTMGATHYHTKAIMPYWAKGKKTCADIGAHLFYKLVM